MSFIYQSQGFVIYPQRQIIVKGEEEIQVRSKTFALLLLLLEKPGEILSKSYLLDSIWDDVKVEEQVLVQSVRELRQLFSNADIIQTYPRKGYAWAAEVKKLDQCKPQTVTASPAAPPKYNSRLRMAYILPAFIVLLGGMLGTVLYQAHTHSNNAQTEVVIVLPVKNQLSGNDYNWVPLGLMDQIIHMLVSDKSVQVMPSEYVFQIMRYARLQRDYESENVSRLFEVSGATLIVEAQLSGIIESYRLEYKLRSRGDVKRGVLFGKDINQLVNQLGQAIANQTGQQMHSADINAQLAFRNELMARGVEKFDQRDYPAAQNLFQSLLQSDPGNIYAREQLIRAFAWHKDYTEAKAEITTALEIAENKEPQTAARLHYYRARIALEEGDVNSTLASMDQADRLAKESNDVLVQAQTSEVRARIYLEGGKLDQARINYEQALKFNGMIRCAIGLSDTHIKLAHLLQLQGQQDLALDHYQQAKLLIETHQLDDLMADLKALNLEKTPATSKI